MFGTPCLREQGMRPGRRCTTAAVRTGDYLQKMAVWIVEVDSAPTIPGVDLPALVAAGVGPIREASSTNPLEDLVELALIHQESVVLQRDPVAGIDIIERCVVANSHHRKR